MLPAEDLRHVLEHAGGALGRLKGARLFVTGGTGFFGRWLLESFDHANRLLGLEAELAVLTRDPAGFARANPQLATSPAIRAVAGDIGSFEFPAGGFSHVIHAATPNSAAVNDNTPQRMLDIIIGGTRRVLEFAAEKRVGSLLFTSSGAVYGPARTAEMATESTRLAETSRQAPDLMNPKNAYAEGKRVAELMCAIAARQSGLQVKIARCFAFVGPYLPLDAHFAIGNFIGNALRGEPINIQGDGRAVRSYLHAADLTAALWTLLAEGESCVPYNIGSPRPVSIRELAQTVADTVSPGLAVNVLGQPNAGMDYYVPDTGRYDARFGPQLRIALDEAIRRTHAFHCRGRAA